MKKEDCIFCKIAGGEIPSNTIYENSEFKVIMDIAPASKGHVLIIPKEHFKDIYEIDAITAGKLFQLATVVARALKEVLHCDGIVAEGVTDNPASVSFTNTYNGKLIPGTGIVNHFENKDGEWSWEQQTDEPASAN